jgi:hypothetical protein
MPAHFSPSNRRFFFKTLLLTGLLCSLTTMYADYYAFNSEGLGMITWYFLDFVYIQPFKWLFTVLVALWICNKLRTPLIYVGLVAVLHALLLLVATFIAFTFPISLTVSLVLGLLIPQDLLHLFEPWFHVVHFLEMVLPQFLAPLMSGWLALKLTFARPFQPLPPDAPNRYDDLHF